jgi:hypothetical protein
MGQTKRPNPCNKRKVPKTLTRAYCKVAETLTQHTIPHVYAYNYPLYMTSHQTNKRCLVYYRGCFLIHDFYHHKNSTITNKKKNLLPNCKLYYHATSTFYLLQLWVVRPNFMNHTFQKYFKPAWPSSALPFLNL